MVCNNLDRQDQLIARIAEVNRNREGEIFTPKLFREHTVLTAEDHRSFVDWLLEVQSAPKRSDLNQKLTALKVRRLALWHVLQAPDGVITADKRMFHFTIMIHIYLFHTQVTR